MPHFIFLFTNPFSLFIYFSVIEIIIKAAIFMQYIHSKHDIKFRLLIYLMFFIFSFIVNYRVMLTNDTRKSPIDAFPITQLNIDDISRLDYIFDLFENYDFVNKFDIITGDNYKVYEFLWFRDNPFSILHVRVKFHINDQEAISTLRRLTYIYNGIYTEHKNINNTEVILFNSYMERSHGFPVSNRILRSLIRISNVTISLDERPEQHQLHMNLSNDFILLVCKLLTQY